MGLMITQGLGLIFFRWNSVLFEGWVSMSVMWEKNLRDPGPQCNSIPRRAAALGTETFTIFSLYKTLYLSKAGGHFICNYVIKNLT